MTNDKDITVKISYKFVPMSGPCVYPAHAGIIEGLGNDGWEFVSIIDTVDSAFSEEKYANAKMLFKRSVKAVDDTSGRKLLND